MLVASFVRKHIDNLPNDTIFTTRDFLSLGSRNAIDSELYRLVKSCRIIRLARGVFIKAGSKLPSLMAIARAKARAFGKSLMTYCCDVSRDLDVCKHENHSVTFAVNGRTSGFDAVGGRVELIGVGPRKTRLGDSVVGRALRSLWHAGNLADNLKKACAPFDRSDRAEFPKAAAWVPARIRIPLKERWYGENPIKRF